MRRTLWLAAVVVGASIWPLPSDAAHLVIESAIAPPSAAPQTIEIDVYAGPSVTSSEQLAGFQLLLAIDGPDNALTFSEALRPVTRDYVFDANPTGPFALISDDGLTIDVGDFLDQGQAAFEEGDGLVTLRLTLAPTSVESAYAIHIVDPGGASFLAEDSQTVLPFTVTAGRVSSIPAPSGALLAFWAMLAVAAVRSH